MKGRGERNGREKEGGRRQGGRKGGMKDEDVTSPFPSEQVTGRGRGGREGVWASGGREVQWAS